MKDFTQTVLDLVISKATEWPDRPAIASLDSGTLSYESKIMELWQTTLQRDVESTDLFLDSGGDSISAAILVYKNEEEFEIDGPLVRFFKSPTVSDQARLIAEIMNS